MRSIALAILLAGGGIEYAILRASGREREYVVAAGVFTMIVLSAFVACLVLGI